MIERRDIKDLKTLPIVLIIRIRRGALLIILTFFFRINIPKSPAINSAVSKILVACKANSLIERGPRERGPYVQGRQ